jgi:hypothetical protein
MIVGSDGFVKSKLNELTTIFCSTLGNVKDDPTLWTLKPLHPFFQLLPPVCIIYFVVVCLLINFIYLFISLFYVIFILFIAFLSYFTLFYLFLFAGYVGKCKTSYRKAMGSIGSGH